MEGNWIDDGRGLLMFWFMVYLLLWCIPWGSKPTKKSTWQETARHRTGHLGWSEGRGR